jgi:uncharacterized protein (DUF488 family)
MSKQPTLYTFGYLASSAERTFAELIETKTPVVDIRYKPVSRQWQYNQQVLSGRSGILYYWIEELGNERYKEALSGKYSEPRIKLHNVRAGLVKLKAILDRHGKAALMCACAAATTCHRRTVADLAAERLGYHVIHLPITSDRRAQARMTPVQDSLSMAPLWDDKQLLTAGLHPEQQTIERDALQHVRRLTQ